MRKVHKDRIDALKKIANKPGKLTKRDDQKIREHLKEISQNTYKEMREASSDMNAMGFAKEKALFKSYEQYFGHPIPNLESGDGKLRVNALCVGNTIAQNKLLEGIGKVGSLEMLDIHEGIGTNRLGHIAPTVKIKGKTYIIEQNGVYTPKEYLDGLVEAHGKGPKQPLSGISRSLFQGTSPKRSDFSRRMRYLGEKGGISSAYGNMGAEYFNSGDLEKAEDAYGKALKADPRNAHANYMFGLLRLGGGKTRSGLYYMKKATRLHKGSTRYPEAIADHYSLEGKHGEAVKYLKEAMKRDRRNPMRYTALAKELFIAGKTSQALDYLEKGIGISPENPLPYIDAAELIENMPDSKKKRRLDWIINEKLGKQDAKAQEAPQRMEELPQKVKDALKGYKRKGV